MKSLSLWAAMKTRDVNWAKPSKALVHFMAAGLTVCDLWPAGIGAMVTLFFRCQELTAASESMEADRRASSSGTSFLAWFPKARNAIDWWWRARDHGKREREVWVRGRMGGLFLFNHTPVAIVWLSIPMVVRVFFASLRIKAQWDFSRLYF